MSTKTQSNISIIAYFTRTATSEGNLLHDRENAKAAVDPRHPNYLRRKHIRLDVKNNLDYYTDQQLTKERSKFLKSNDFMPVKNSTTRQWEWYSPDQVAKSSTLQNKIRAAWAAHITKTQRKLTVFNKTHSK